MSCDKFQPWDENPAVCGACMHLKCPAKLSTDMEAELTKAFRAAILKAYPQVAAAVPKMHITPAKAKGAHYQCNNAMGLCKQLSMMKPPVKSSPGDVAEAIVSNVDWSTGLVEKVEAVKPQGFINITVGPKYIQRGVNRLAHEGIAPPEVKKQKILVDFSSPNIAKTMHVGHLRSTIIGDSICRLFEFCGHEVLRTNHVGDWGTQFGMLIAHLKSKCPNFLTTPPDITDLVKFYKEAKARFDAEPDFKAVSYQEVVKLQSGDDTNLKAWRMICDISRLEFSETYRQLDVTLEEKGESFYNPIIPDVLKVLDGKGMCEVQEGAKIITASDWKPLDKLAKGELEKTVSARLVNAKARVEKVNPVLLKIAMDVKTAKEEEGKPHIKIGKDKFVPVETMTHEDADKFLKECGNAKVFKPLHADLKAEMERLAIVKGNTIAVPVFPIPLIVTKSDGGFSYDTTDMAAVWYRTQKEQAHRVVYVTDLGQEGHFMMIFRAARDAGWDVHQDGSTIRFDHVGFGVVCGKDGKRFKTRSGETAALKDLLAEGIAQSYDISVKRQQEKVEKFEALKAAGENRDEKIEVFDEKELQEISEAVGIGAIKYCDLRQNRLSDYVFDREKMCSLDGNTVMYMQYAYARCCSLARKAGIEDIESIRKTDVQMELDCEFILGLWLLKFPSIIEKTCDTLMAHNITDYLYALAHKFSDCYNEKQWKVVGHPLQNSRLLLADATAQTIKKGLELLGIKVLARI